jgi:small conductance mechanosensitive channel
MQGVTGIVKEVLLAYTIISDQDNVHITIPIKHIVGEILHNSKHDSLLELTLGIAYKEDPIQVFSILEKVIDKLNIGWRRTVLPQIGIGEFADSISIYRYAYGHQQLTFMTLNLVHIKLSI